MTAECRRSFPTWIEQSDMTGVLSIPEREMAQTVICTRGEGGHDFGNHRLAGTVCVNDHGHSQIEGDFRLIEATDVPQA
jgi:hypothetical protein